jgi:uncharacterized protein YjbJ (UPF0337 family)
MNKDIIKGKWKEVKGQLRQQWGKFTDDDVEKMKGSYEELHGLLRKRYGYEKDETDKKIEEFVKKNKWEDK